MTFSDKDALNQIIMNVERIGYHEIPFDVLANTAFKPSQNPNRSTKEKILIWAVESGLRYEYIDGSIGTIVRFYKK